MKPTTQIILAGVVAVLILALLLLIIWWNRDTDRTSGILVKAVVAPLLVAAALLATEILSPLPAVKAEIPVVIFRDYNAELVPVFQPLALSGALSEIPALFSTYRKWLANNPPPASAKAAATGDNSEVVERREFFLDLFEASFWSWLWSWSWLSKDYSLHWRVQRKWFQGISSGGGSVSVAPDAERKPVVLAAGDVARRLPGNTLLEPPSPVTLGSVSFPRGTEVTVDRNKLRRRTRVTNRHLQLNITFELVGGGLVGATTLAERLKARFPVDPIWVDHIQATVNCQFSYLFRWSPATSRQREWVDEKIAGFRTEFGWDFLREKLDAAL
jgi:hypothetical protein